LAGAAEEKVFTVQAAFCGIFCPAR